MSSSISVIIPAYRAARTIGRAVDSLLAQTLSPEEILIIDDGSPDDLASVLAPYGLRVRLIRQSNSGASVARNRGIDAAQGEFIAFLDADDYWEPVKLQCQAEIFRRYPEVGVVASRYFVQDPGSPKVLPPPDDRRWLDRVLGLSTDSMLEIISRLWTSTVMVRRSAMGEHRFDCRLKVAEDLDLWIRLMAEHSAYILSQPLAIMVFESASLSRSDPDEGYAPMIDVARRYPHVVSRRSLKRFEARVYRGWASAHLKQGRPHAAWRPAWRRLCRQPFSFEAWWIIGKCAALAWAGRGRPSSADDGGTLCPTNISE